MEVGERGTKAPPVASLLRTKATTKEVESPCNAHTTDHGVLPQEPERLSPASDGGST